MKENYIKEMETHVVTIKNLNNKIDEKQKNNNTIHTTKVFNEPKYDVKLIKKSI